MDSQSLRVSNKTVAIHVVKRAIFTLVSCVLVYAVCAVGATLTMVRTIHVSDDVSYIVRANYGRGGFMTPGTPILLESDSEVIVEHGIAGNAKNAIFAKPTACPATVITGGEGRLTLLKDSIVHHDKVVFEGQYSTQLKSGHVLNKSYLVQPSDSCPSTDLIEATDNNTYGAIAKDVSLW